MAFTSSFWAAAHNTHPPLSIPTNPRMPPPNRGLQISAVPSYFKCPISLELMRDPVSLCTGLTYDRLSIERWLDDGNHTCPATMQVLESQELIPNHTLRRLIQEWGVLNRCNGVERIPTPQPPADPQKVRSMLSEIASRSHDRLIILKSLRNLAKESDRNRRCITSEGAAAILVDVIGPLNTETDREVIQVSQEVLDTLVLLPLEEGNKRTLLATKLDSVSWLLNRAFSIETRVNAASLLESLAVDKSAMLNIGSTKGVVEGLIALLRDNFCPIAVKSALKALLTLCSPLRIRVKAVTEMEVIPAIVDLLPGANRSTTEQVMCLLGTLSSCADGRSAINGYALAVPAIARSMLVISDITTEHALHVLWSIVHHTPDEKTRLQELCHLGVVEKLLVLVQLENKARAKQEAKDLLRLLTEINGDTSSACEGG